MAGMVANGPAVTEDDISNYEFWPSINPESCRDAMGIDSAISAKRLRMALINAMTATNIDLRYWVSTQQGIGYATLQDVPAEQIDGESINIQLYRRAVYCAAKAELLERYRDYDSTLSGSQRADELEATIGDVRRDGRAAIRDLIGESRITVELI